MKTIIVTDARAAELVGKGDAEYASGDVHLEPPVPAHAAVLLPPVVQHNENGKRVDQPCLPGTPGTVTLSATGHTLSKPVPWDGSTGEMFAGYCERVWRQADGDVSALGYAMQDTTPWFERFGGYKADGSNWPQAADFFFDTIMKRGSYLTDEEKHAQEAAKQQWADVGKRIGDNAPHTTVTPPSVQPPVETQAPASEVEVPLQPSQA